MSIFVAAPYRVRTHAGTTQTTSAGTLATSATLFVLHIRVVSLIIHIFCIYLLLFADGSDSSIIIDHGLL